NTSGKSIEPTDFVALAAPNFHHAAIFDPMTGRIGRADLLNAGGDRGIELQLKPGESWIVQILDAPPDAADWVYAGPRGPAQQLAGKWSVKFVKGGPELPSDAEIDSLKSWTEFDGHAVKAFSGTATYSIHFPKPQTVARAYRLELGKVAESARIAVNGEE